MGRRDRNQFVIKTHPHQHAIVEMIRDLSRVHNPYTVFTDFIEMSALAWSNQYDWPQREKREERYMEVIKRYVPDELTKFARMFAELRLCYLERVDAHGAPGLGGHVPVGEDGDILGKIFSMLEIGNDRLGQFFTPDCVQKLMAAMLFPDENTVREDIREHGFFTIEEPACGAGGMIIAAAENLHHLGFSYPSQFHATCIDKDRLCVHMTYLQLSLLGIPAIVIHGNTLTLETWDTWFTPAHICLGWGRKLRRRREMEQAQSAIRQVEELLQTTAETAPPETKPATNSRSVKIAPTPRAASSASPAR